MVSTNSHRWKEENYISSQGMSNWYEWIEYKVWVECNFIGMLSLSKRHGLAGEAPCNYGSLQQVLYFYWWWGATEAGPGSPEVDIYQRDLSSATKEEFKKKMSDLGNSYKGTQ